MDNISTPISTPTVDSTNTDNTAAVSKQTLERIKQFARAYMPIGQMPGIVLN